MARFDEKTIKVTEYNVLGELPDPFLKPDGTRASSIEEYEELKKEHYKSVVELQYGTIPPKPEFLTVQKMGKGRKSTSYRVTTGRKDFPVSFTMRVFLPQTEEKCPVIVDGDLSFDYITDEGYLDAALDAGVGFAIFDRVELVPDVREVGRHAPLYDCYPEYTFGTLGAWAWGYSRCVDALEQLDIIDNDWIAFSGHSRGGKTAMLAGILDERAKIVNPNETNAGSCSCYRIHMKAINEEGVEKRSETLAALLSKFDFWMGKDMQKYAECEEKLPFDAHFTKAMIAPRILLVGEAASDIWTNPIGTWMTTQAAGEVYKLYGKSENLIWYFRHGIHRHKPEDIKMLVSVIKHKRDGLPLNDEFYSTPFEEPELIYSWRCPQK